METAHRAQQNTVQHSTARHTTTQHTAAQHRQMRQSFALDSGEISAMCARSAVRSDAHSSSSSSLADAQAVHSSTIRRDSRPSGHKLTSSSTSSQTQDKSSLMGLIQKIDGQFTKHTARSSKLRTENKYSPQYHPYASKKRLLKRITVMYCAVEATATDTYRVCLPA